MRFALIAAGIAGGSSVVMGAVSSHLATSLGPLAAGWLQIGLNWQTVHAVALLALGAQRAAAMPSRWLDAAAWLWTAGILLFSGSLYLMALTGVRDIGMLTPFGGLALILGWGCIVGHACRAGRHS